ncbi:SIR2 family protein [Streptomyces sp. NPDC047990]|uniref:SIR2 family protein n=1 Tax=Streptomyces sp. NPDC047990 TaxID=3365496 RepID=UPI003714B4C7
MTSSSTPTNPGALVVPPGSALNPMVALATSVHASPRVYALLLGAGVSMGAGIKTGWGVVEDLVRRAAVADDPGSDTAGEDAAQDPQAWWDAHETGPLGYSALLAALGKTPAARQALLSGYFDADPDDADDKRPGASHRAIAELVRRGSIGVIITTNFDRLTERALEEAGITPQIIHRPEDYASAAPLQHRAVTVIKVHGDYLDYESLNTDEELSTYPGEQADFLDRVFDEYGLIICGWSADWDRALVRAISGIRSRRYPMFWSQYGTAGAEARSLAARHNAAVITGATADEFFPDLVRRLDALDKLAEVPPTREMAVAQLKRSLADPVRRIELHDLVTQATDLVISRATPDNYPLHGDVFEQNATGYRRDADTLLHLLAAGAFHDDGTYDALWVRTVQGLVRLRQTLPASHNGDLESLRHYPALLAAWTMGVAAVAAGREEFVGTILTRPVFKSPLRQETEEAAIFLNSWDVLPKNSLDRFCVPGPQQKWKYPASHYLRQETTEVLRSIEPDDAAVAAAYDRFEFLASLFACDSAAPRRRGMPWPGQYLFEDRWGEDDHGLFAEISADADLRARLAPVFRNITIDEALTQLADWRRRYHNDF